jgi:septum site-determining protein MinC
LRFRRQSAILAADLQLDDPVRVRHRPQPIAISAATETPRAPYDLFEAAPIATAHPTDRSRKGTIVSELRFGQLGIAQLTLRSLDPATVWAELDAKVKAAPQLFTLAPLVIDLGQLEALPTLDEVRALIASVREAGLLPVGLARGDEDTEALARTMDLPLFAKLKLPVEAAAAKVEVQTPVVPAAPTIANTKSPPSAATSAATPPSGLHHKQPVRSGQQVYARGRDLTLTAMVGNGAEVIADGSIHIYGTLRGRALAGAQGDTAARIYCQNFQAELISIAGQYRVFEDMPAELRGKPVQAWLEDDKLKLAVLA